MDAVSSASNLGAWIYLVLSAAIIVVPLVYIMINQHRHSQRLEAIAHDTNSSVTEMKRDQMHDLEAHVALLEEILQDRMTDAHRGVIDRLKVRIERYRDEIERREEVAGK